MRTPKANPFNWEQMTDEQINKQLYEVDLADIYYYPQGYNPYNSNPIKHDSSKLVINKHTREVVSDRAVSNQYKPIQTRTALDYTLHQLQESEIQHKVVRIDNHSAYQHILIALPAQDIEVKVGDIVEQYFMLGTAHNGLRNLNLTHFTKRLWCLNGATTNKKEMELSILHKGDTDRRIQDGLNLYLEGCVKEIARLYDWLLETRINRTKLDMYLGIQEILAGEYYKERLKEEIADNNMFSVYQAFTKLITHEYGRTLNAKLNKYQQLNKETNKWYDLFAECDMVLDIMPAIGHKQYQREYLRPVPSFQGGQYP